VSNRTPFISAEDIEEALSILDMPFEVTEIKGEANLRSEDSPFLEKFFKFCTFSKDLITLEKLMNTPNTRRYIDSIRQNNGNFRLNLTSKMFVIKEQDLAACKIYSKLKDTPPKIPPINFDNSLLNHSTATSHDIPIKEII